MSHKTLINGTSYEITKGITKIDGSQYEINKGKTLIGGTAYDINFQHGVTDLRDTYWKLTNLPNYNLGYGSYYIKFEIKDGLPVTDEEYESGYFSYFITACMYATGGFGQTSFDYGYSTSHTAWGYNVSNRSGTTWHADPRFEYIHILGNNTPQVTNATLLNFFNTYAEQCDSNWNLI